MSLTKFDIAVLTMGDLAEGFAKYPDDKACYWALKGMQDAIGALRGTLSRNLGISTIEPSQENIKAWRSTSLKTEKETESKESIEREIVPDELPKADVSTEKSSLVATSSVTARIRSGKTTGTVKRR